MNRFRITRSVIPNLFTALNMFSGFLSIINASEGKFISAAWYIIAAAVFDMLDGALARLTKSSSELGVELDSLSDIVSFGAAPAFLIYSSYLSQYEVWGIIISSLLMIAGGFRLARFNVQLVGFDKKYFVGLPIPSSGLTMAAFVIAYYNNDSGYSEPFSSFIIPLIIILSFMMVSRARYETIPKFSARSIKEKPFDHIFAAAGIIILVITKGKALFFIFVFIIVFGIFRHIFQLVSKRNKS
jgi:CDP-diacylglycerol--serine O-phosphatidyltransferase